jgi:superoxide dismutase, Cu-Zn family
MKKASKMDVTVAAAVCAVAVASLGACTNPNSSQPATSTSSSQSNAGKMTTQLKSTDGNVVANATFEFTNGYATVTVEAGPNQVLSPGFHALMVHSVGQCVANSPAPTGGSTGDFESAGDVYQAPNHTGTPASGELTDLQVRPDGSAKLVTTTSAFTAADLRNSSGSALILHQDAGNLGASAMNEAGKRVACGVIAAPASTTSSSTATTSVSTVTTTVAVPPPSTSTSTVTVTSPTSTTAPTMTGTTSPPPGG